MISIEKGLLPVRAAPRGLPGLLSLIGVLGVLCLPACSPIGMAIGVASTAGIAASQERGFETAVDDQIIRIEINRLWFEHSLDIMQSVSLQVQEGRVVLSGNLPSADEAILAVRLAWQPEGVREVINEISYRQDTNLEDLWQDRLIKSDLSSKLLLDRDVLSINYSIEVVNRRVILLGVAQSEEELRRVIAHAKATAYVRDVVSYLRVKEEELQASQ